MTDRIDDLVKNLELKTLELSEAQQVVERIRDEIHCLRMSILQVTHPHQVAPNKHIDVGSSIIGIRENGE